MKPHFQFRLRTLFVVVTLVALASALGVQAAQKYHEWRLLRRERETKIDVRSGEVDVTPLPIDRPATKS